MRSFLRSNLSIKFFSKNSILWILIFGALLIALLSSFNNIDSEKKTGEFYWQSHQEGVSQAHTKDDSLTPVDGFSREFPIVYNFLGDSALGYISSLMNKPPYEIQSFFYPKFLAILFLVANFISIYLITKNRLASLLSTLLLMFGSDIIYFDELYKTIDPNIVGFKARMHLPSIALPLGVGQSAGWVLFLPIIACIYIARKNSSLSLYLLSGIGLGVLFQTHTLTFINVMTIISIWFLASESNEKSSLQWLRRAGFLTVFILIASFSREFGLMQLAALWSCAFIFSIRERKDLVRLLVMGISAIAVSYQFILSIINSIALKGGFELRVDSSVDYRLVASYFLIYWLLFALVFLRQKSEAEKLGVVVVVCTLAFGFGQLFGFYNHQYRFVINLCFGLFLIAPLAILKLNEFQFWNVPLSSLRKGQQIKWLPVFVIFSLGILFAILLALSAYRDVMIQTGHADKVTKLGYNMKYFNVNYASKSESLFLHALSSLPSRERVMLPPEDAYPRRLFHNAIILGTGDFRAFIPDYRYLVDKKSYKDRVFVYCSIFTNYQHLDAHYNDRFCSDFSSVARYRGNGKEVLDVLGIYGINYIIQWPEAGDAQVDSLYDASIAYRADNGYRIWRTNCKSALDSGRVCFGTAKNRMENIYFPIIHAKKGEYNFCFSGQNLANNITNIKLAGIDVAYSIHGTDTVAFTINFSTEAVQNISFDFKKSYISSNVPISPFYFAAGTLITSNKSKCE